VATFPNPNPLAHEAQRAWRAMLQLVEIVEKNGSLPVVPPAIMLRPGEVQHGGRFIVDCLVHCGADVEYSQGYAVSGGLLFTAVGMAIGEASLARARREAFAYARPQWRIAGRMPLFLTNQRLLIMADGQWKSYWLESLVSMDVRVEAYAVELYCESENPLRLIGPWVPWLAVAISALRTPQPWPPPFLHRFLPPRTGAVVVVPQVRALTAVPAPGPGPDQLARHLASLDPAGAAEIVRGLSPDLAQHVLGLLEPHRADEIRRLL
jgi:hypothetical protein